MKWETYYTLILIGLSFLLFILFMFWVINRCFDICFPKKNKKSANKVKPEISNENSSNRKNSSLSESDCSSDSQLESETINEENSSNDKEKKE
jgi:hypothetical protein